MTADDHAPPPLSAAEASLMLDAVLERNIPDLRDYVRYRMDGLLRTKESASDLVQSVCGDVIAHLDRFQHGGESNFRQWLFRTAERKIVDRYRYYTADRRDAGREAAPDESDADIGTAPSPSHHAAAREELDRMQTVLSNLADEDRKVIVLSRLLGLPHKEIGRLLGYSEVAVRQRLHRALAEVALRLGPPPRRR